MWEIVFGLILNLILFFFLGFWPVFFFIGAEDRLLRTFALAPIFGYAIASIVSTFLILLNFPVSEWVEYYKYLIIIINLVLFFIFFRKEKFTQIHLHNEMKWLIGGIILTSIIVTLPMVLGGSQFVTFRGNGTDNTNYITMARFLDQESYSLKYTATIDELASVDSSYPYAVNLLSSRWTTSAVFALCAEVAKIPIYLFDYAYTLIFFIMSFGPVYLIGRKIKIKPLASQLAGIIVCTGFWAQFVLDIRAFSEISSIPLLLMFAFLTVHVIESEFCDIFNNAILVSIVIASLVYSYVEMIPLCIMSITIFLVLLFFKKKITREYFKYLGISVLLILLLITPLYSFLWDFFINQFIYASQGKNNWEIPFFTWLYDYPIIGFWGLVPFTFIESFITKPVVKFVVKLILNCIGCVLYLLSCGAIIKAVFRKQANIPIILILSFVLGTIIQFLVLYMNEQLWAAGKALAYGYPFFILILFGVVFRKNYFSLPPIITRGIKIIFIIWLISQTSLTLARNNVAVTGNEYKDYIVSHGEYRLHDYDLSEIESYLEDKPDSIIWTLIPNEWMAIHVNFAFGDNEKLIDAYVNPDQQNIDSAEKISNELPQYLLANKELIKFNPAFVENIVAKNNDLVLIQIENSTISVVNISSANGIEDWGGRTALWIGEEKITISILSTINSQAEFSSEFILGPSLPEKEERELRIYYDGVVDSMVTTVGEGLFRYSLYLHPGLNTLQLEILDKPTVFQIPNGDTRIMLLGIIDPAVNIINE